MKRRMAKGAAAATVLLLAAGLSWREALDARQAQPSGAVSPTLEQLFRTPPDDARMMMRWWWFGPSITREEIDAEMRRMKEGGIGGFEIAVVYPMAVDDQARGIRNYPYLSADFLDRVGYAARLARSLGLRMDVTLGSGWPFGGPHITPDLASRRLRSDRREITPDVRQVQRPAPNDHEGLIAGFVGRGALREVDANSFQELDLSGSGAITIPPGAGPRTLVFYFDSPTGQVVKRAALGAEGYVLDHYNRSAIEKHLAEVGDKLVAAAGPGNIHAIFCDSLEVYEAGWTGDMLVEFQKRRGYPLQPMLPLVEFGSDDRAQQLRRDVGRTLTELYEERFLQPIHDWSRRNNVLFRMQAYGQPPSALASHRLIDLIDGEGFEWRTLSRIRWAASAAHLLNRPIVASETWTWIHSPAFRATPLDLKGEADLHFLSGVNQLIGHGWPHTAAKTASPGWPFYAAGAFTDKNPWWPVMPDLAAYLHRVSFMLRQGEPVADIAIYAPSDDARAAMRPGTGDYLNLWMGVRDRIGPSIVPAILDAGYSFDLFDDRTLKEAEARQYKALVLAGSRAMPDETRRWIDAFAKSGGKVVSHGSLVPQLVAAVEPDVLMTPATPEIGFVHRRLTDRDVYFLVNTSNVPRDVMVRFKSRTPNAELWNPFDGSRERLSVLADGRVSLRFNPYESRTVVFRASPGDAPAVQSRTASTFGELRSGWTVSYATPASVGPVQVDLPHSWALDAARQHFSGTATYRRRIVVPGGARAGGSRVVLDFGAAQPIEREALPDGTMRGNSFAALVDPPVREAAAVIVNGTRAGVVWAPPYRVDLTEHLRDGANEIAIEVYNTAINQLAEVGRIPDVRAVTERHGQRFRLQDMDGLQPLPSGILSVPRLVMER